MKKKILSLILAVAFVLSCASPAYAETENTHYYISLLNDPSIKLDFMVSPDNSDVFIRADYIADFLQISGMDFEYLQSAEECMLKSDYYDYFIVFNYDSKEVNVITNALSYTYKAPSETFTDWGYAWIPFEFTMKVFNIPYLIFPSGIEIYTAEPNELMILSYMRYATDLSFSWVNELGYSETDMKLMTGSSRVVNMFGDLLSGDFLSRWGDVAAATFTGKNFFTDRKATKTVASLFTNPSTDEIEAGGGESFKTVVEVIGSTIDALEPTLITSGFIEMDKLNCREVVRSMDLLFKEFPALQNNDELIDIYVWFGTNAVGYGDLSVALKKADAVSKGLFGLKHLIGMGSFIKSFENKSETAIAAINRYAEILDNHTSSVITEYTAAIDKSEIGKKLFIYFKDNLGDAIFNLAPLAKIITAPAFLVLVGWDIARNITPYLKDTFDSTEKFEIAKYAVAHQTNACNLFKKECKYLKSTYDGEDVYRDSLKDLRSLAYSYLKFSVVARNSANAALQVGEGLTDSAKQTVNQKLTKKNKKIAELLRYFENKSFLYLPEDVSDTQWYTDDIIYVLKKEGLEIVNLNNATTTSPYYQEEIVTETEPYDDAITEEDAIAMVKEVMCQTSYVEMLFDTMLSDILSFEVVDVVEVEEYSIDAYVIAILIDGVADYYHLFVPIDGSAVWMGWVEEDGGYYCYPYVDMYNMSVSEVLLTLGEMMLEAQLSGEQY